MDSLGLPCRRSDAMGASPRHIHLLGICGTGMAALAGILHEQGFVVTGSDEHVYPPMSTFLAGLGLAIREGYRPENLEPPPDLVVVGNVIRRENPEAQAVEARGLPRLSLPEALNRFLVNGRHSLVVAGTHGKTTTTALLAWLLYAAGLDPGFMVGGLSRNFASNYRVGAGPYVVLEGDEYDTAFFDKRPKLVHFQPRVAILTSVEFDHADIYPDLAAVCRAFRDWVAGLTPEATLLAWGDGPLVREVAASTPARRRFYGFGGENHWQAREVRPVTGGMAFRVWRGGERFGEFTAPLLGRHNVLNCLAALAALMELGLTPGVLKEGLSGFQGVKRRQEPVCGYQGILVLDDFAHHPTAVAATLEAVREGHPGRRLLAVFEPRTNTSRRQVFQADYARAFGAADMVFVREPPDLWKVPEGERFSSERLVQDLRARGQEAFYFPDTDGLLAGLLNTVRPGDVVLVMSNGDFDHLVPRLCAALGGTPE
ncbi:MAG: UDP-N-acetylmuramate:L-alanyl-gamma-D-glutamyl-meso-diaminopimelate ligase [Syntrophobacterales bacterium]|nr:UDP-N-acetylmuramate:L-alanyl-gamma-D-glutamyl-meso-diaminopimelate ligase [Syntrophobacterales bacterium]